MITLSLCMIVRDEEAVLARCLDSAQGIADEIVLVDTGSRDRTKEVAARYTDRIYDFPWRNDFSAARNYALSLARMDYCFWLDADDVIPEKSREALRNLKSALPPETDLVMLRYDMGLGPDGTPSCSFFPSGSFTDTSDGVLDANTPSSTWDSSSTAAAPAINPLCFFISFSQTFHNTGHSRSLIPQLRSQRPLEPQGKTNPVWVTGSPSSSARTVPPYFF